MGLLTRSHSGFDPSAHGGDILQLICVVRDWLRANLEPNERIPGGEYILERYKSILASSARILRGRAPKSGFYQLLRLPTSRDSRPAALSVRL